MMIINESKKTTISGNAKEATSFLDRSLGLLNKQNPRSLIFYTHFGLHTFGLDTPIDILVLNGECKVIKAGKSIRPNRFFFYNPIYRIIIELPDGSIALSETGPGDKIKFT